MTTLSTAPQASAIASDRIASPPTLEELLAREPEPRRSDRTETALRRAGLGDILDKVLAEERLSIAEGVRLFEHPSLNLVGYLANIVRERKNGRLAFFNRNQHINYTNVCNKGCKFCAFQRLPGEEGAYTMSPEDVAARIRAYLHLPVTEVHMVAGINAKLNYQYYLDILRAVKAARPSIHIKAFTMVELEQIRRVAKKPIQEVLEDLKGAGLDSCPGGGAEIFEDRVHQELFGRKLDSNGWLAMQREVHQAGLRSNATMLYGHIETPAERADHFDRLRRLQDETGGFQTFIPLAFHPENTELDYIPPTSGETDLRVMAVARLMLDNFPHVKAYWVMLTQPIAQLALSFGADDIDGTIMEEKIYHEAGAKTPMAMTRSGLVRLIREAGRIPVERDTVYHVLDLPALN
jgi:aminodeoxyfutalosine synthase